MSDQIIETNNFTKIFQKNLKRYLKHLIITILIIFLGVLILLFVENRKEKNQILISEEFINAKIFLQQEKNSQAKIILMNIVNKKNKFYSPLSLSLLMSNNLETDYKKIINAFDKIISINSFNKEELNLIIFKKIVFLSQFNDEQTLLETANKIVNSNSQWRKETIKILIDYFSSKGEKVKASEYINLLSINK